MSTLPNLENYTRAQAQEIRMDYEHLIGQFFLFNKDPEIKDVLFNIWIAPYNENEGQYHLVFISAKLESMIATDFFELNEISFNKHKYVR